MVCGLFFSWLCFSATDLLGRQTPIIWNLVLFCFFKIAPSYLESTVADYFCWDLLSSCFSQTAVSLTLRQQCKMTFSKTDFLFEKHNRTGMIGHRVFLMVDIFFFRQWLFQRSVKVKPMPPWCWAEIRPKRPSLWVRERLVGERQRIREQER